MLAKITAKNQLTLPKSLVQAVGAEEYFDVEARGGQIILTPVRVHRADRVRAKLAELGITQEDVASAVQWARQGAVAPELVAEPAADYGLRPNGSAKKAPSKKAPTKKAVSLKGSGKKAATR